MLTPKDKIIKYLKIKGISQDKFSRTCGVSSGFLRQGRSFNVEFVKIIRDKFTDLNLKWVIFDEGEMLLSSDNIAKRTSEVYGLNYKDKYIDVLEENRELNKENRELNKKNNLLRENNEMSKKPDNHISV